MAYDKTPQSRNEEILISMINKTEYDKTPQSREEELLLALKDAIEQGGDSQHQYSTDERVVGTWIDGSLVYERTIDRHLIPIAMHAYTWYVFDTITESIHIIDAFGNDVDNGIISSSYPIVVNADDNGDISVMHLRYNTQITLGYITIRYTKTTN